MSGIRRFLRLFRVHSATLLREECGQSIVAVALAFTVLIGAAAFAVDLGLSYTMQKRLQNAADAAALAGVRALPDADEAVRQALYFAEQNGADPAHTSVTTPYEGDEYRIEVICSCEIPYSFAAVFGKDNGIISARAVAECQPLRGPFDYAIFSGAQKYELPFNVGSMQVTGGVHSNDDIALRSGGITINGDVEAVDCVTVNGGITINGGIYAAQTVKDGHTIAQGDPADLVDMPDFTELIRTAAQQAGTYYSKSKQFNGSICVDDPIFVEGDISFNAPTVVSGSGIIIATGNITFNAACVLSTNSSACFYSKNGNIVVNAGQITVDGLLYAPSGMIQANTSSFTVNGRVVANKLQFNCSSVRICWGENDRDCLPRLEFALIE